MKNVKAYVQRIECERTAVEIDSDDVWRRFIPKSADVTLTLRIVGDVPDDIVTICNRDVYLCFEPQESKAQQ